MLKTRKISDNTIPRTASDDIAKNRLVDITFGTIFSVMESGGGCPPESGQTVSSS